MGCQASKPAVETAPSSTTPTRAPPAAAAPAIRSSHKQQQQQQPSPRSNNKKQQQQQQSAAKERQTTTNSDPSLYKALAQVYQYSLQSQTQLVNNSASLSSLPTLTHSQYQQELHRMLTTIIANNTNNRRWVITRYMASFRERSTGQTPLHLVCKLLDAVCLTFNETALQKNEINAVERTARQQQQQQQSTNPMAHPLVQIMQQLLHIHPAAMLLQDTNGNLPLHYAIIPYGSLYHKKDASSNIANTSVSNHYIHDWALRMAAVQMLLQADPHGATQYLQRHNVPYDETERCSPLYRVLQLLPDDFDSHAIVVHSHGKNTNSQALVSAPPPPPLLAVDYVGLLRDACNDDHANTYMATTTLCNASNGDQPLALLYRRFTRQFDLAEQFFKGDNSRPDVIKHRVAYKTAAGNTWKLIELLLSPKLPHEIGATNDTASHKEPWRLVHRAVQLQTPPDLLRYIVETNAHDLTVKDAAGNLPLHYAAKSRPPPLETNKNGPKAKASSSKRRSQDDTQDADDVKYVPAFYTKYVVDELLYKFPEAASVPDAEGNYPLTCAVVSGKQWIGGGIKSLYDAYPEALQQIDLKEHETLRLALIGDSIALSPMNQDYDEEESLQDTSIKSDESSVEEKKLDQLAAAAIASPLHSKRMIRDQPYDAIMLVQQVNVNATEVVASMWAHEEDAGVQMLSCVAISRLVQSAIAKAAAEMKLQNESGDLAIRNTRASEDVLRIALSAVAGVVNAMKAHPSEVVVQEKASNALRHMARTDGRNEISFVALGAVAALVGAMQAHVSDAGVQEEACAALSEIIRYGGADRATVVASVSGVTAIINAIAAHPTVVGVQTYGCLALKSLTDFPSAYLPELPMSQTEPLLMTAAKNFPEECSSTVDVVLSRLS
ncbi:hypothetical protein MPSEU_000526600 [Mayamaea pseudoterrestris]|nr:hypothetical protein MPSEU_000526600 [Mayamaea pseudoterrestris]